MAEIKLSPAARRKKADVMARINGYRRDLTRKQETESKNAILRAFFASHDNSFELKEAVCSSSFSYIESQVWGFQYLSGDRLKRLHKLTRIKKNTAIPAARNKNVTWEMVHSTLKLSERGEASGYSVNIFLRNLNEDVWTEEFITDFLRYINGRKAIPLDWNAPRKTDNLLNTDVVYSHARRVFDLEGYPDEWVAQVIIG